MATANETSASLLRKNLATSTLRFSERSGFLKARQFPAAKSCADSINWVGRPLALAHDERRFNRSEWTQRARESDFRNTIPRFNPENRRANQALVDLLSKFAEKRKVTPAQLALAWLLAKKPWIVPIPGTTKLHRLEENLGAANVDLTPEDLRAIESASSDIKVEGARYPQWAEQTTGR